jgi:transposase
LEGDGDQISVRGTIGKQPELLCLINPESRVPATHPLRAIKKFVDEVLRSMTDVFEKMYAQEGRPSIAPERLLKAKVLIALYSVRSERLFCEMLEYNLLFRWFLDMDMMESAWDASTFSKNQERLKTHCVGAIFFTHVVERAREENWISDEHFTVDGTLIEAWASLKSFKPHGEQDQEPPDDPGNPTVNFHNERRSNQTHQSSTDPEARLAKKGHGKEAKLCFGGHALMENRHGLCVDLQVRSTEVTEVAAAKEMVELQQEIGQVAPKTIGADKAYHSKEFVDFCREEEIKPHVATRTDRRTPGLDGRTTHSKGYAQSQKVRKRIEEIFGWMKTVGGFRKSRYRGVERTQLCAYFVGASYNLLRMAKLVAVSPG